MKVGSMVDLVPITGLYSAIFVVFLIVLSAAVIRRRVKDGVSLGDGGKKRLQRAVRAQGNFTEYVPFALLLMLLLELGGTADGWLHALGLVLIGGRILHAIAIYRGILKMRVAGQAFTFTVLAAGAAPLMYRAVA
jgi:uncharacterized membrane protein YecN with MAPEG domain